MRGAESELHFNPSVPVSGSLLINPRSLSGRRDLRYKVGTAALAPPIYPIPSADPGRKGADAATEMEHCDWIADAGDCPPRGGANRGKNS